jgi:hypothetical protein
VAWVVFRRDCDWYELETSTSNDILNPSCMVAVVAAIILLLSCCMITRRRRFARSTNPSVKPPIFGTAPPGSSLPFWSNHNQNAQPSTYQNGYTGDAGATNTGGYQYPPPARQTSGDLPPPPYGKASEGETTYAPVGAAHLPIHLIVTSCSSSLLDPRRKHT